MTDTTHKPLLNKLLTVAGIGLFSVTFAHADVTLKVDDNIKVTVLNGKQYNTSLFQPLQKTFTLQPGKHVITAKYDRLYDLTGDNHDYLRSGNVTVTADLEDNQTYRLAMPGQPERYQEAQKYAKSPTLAVMKGSTVVAQTKGSTEQGGLFSGLSSIFGGNDAQIENQKAIAAVNSSSTTTQSSSATAIAPVEATTTSYSAKADTLDNFMQLWLQATPNERDKIRQWIQK